MWHPTLQHHLLYAAHFVAATGPAQIHLISGRRHCKLQTWELPQHDASGAAPSKISSERGQPPDF